MPMRFNPPPGWPPAPPGWVPPPGWQPDPSWPDPPPGWNLCIEDTASRDQQIRTARWVIAGGGAVFLGSLLPFLTSSQPDLYPVNSNPKETASFFGVVLAALGLAMLAKAKRARLISLRRGGNQRDDVLCSSGKPRTQMRPRKRMRRPVTALPRSWSWQPCWLPARPMAARRRRTARPAHRPGAGRGRRNGGARDRHLLCDEPIQ